VSIDAEDSGKIFDNDLSVVLGDLYIIALTPPCVMCRHYTDVMLPELIITLT
jgi:hypothetical protein